MEGHDNLCIYIWNQISINLYLCTEFSVGLYIVTFLFKIEMWIMLNGKSWNETIYFKMLHCASLEMYINLLYIISSLFIPPSFYTEDKLALITFKTFFLKGISCWAKSV